MKDKIIKLLKENQNKFISGQKISETLNVSRTAIWKHMNLLKKEGYSIESISRRGYNLTSMPDILTQKEIKDFLNTKIIGQKIIHYDSIESTNTKAKELASNGLDEGTVIISEEQTEGRGRLGRSWTSPKSRGIWMSLVLRPDILPTEATKLTQIAAAAVCKSIREIGINTFIKWPNDIILNNKKVCGILTEISAELNMVNFIVIGIGINANIDDNEFPEEIRSIATSLKNAFNKEINRKELTARILNNFESLYLELIDNNSIKKSIGICKDSSILLGKEIRIIYRDREESGIAIDLTDQGELLVKYNNGDIEKIISGEVSVRGVNGYV